MKKLSSTLKYYLCKGLSVIGFVYCAGGVASPATAALATFDSLTEGFVTPVLTDGGIRFSDLDQRLSGPYNPVFVIERADESLKSPFSPPNVLTFGGYAPGPGASFGRFGSLAISTGELASVASLDIFSLQIPVTDNILTLEAYLDGTLVGSNSVNFKTDDIGILYRQLFISDVTFDKLRLVASGSQEQGVLFIDIDNVRIDQTAIVPEASSILGLLMVGVSGVVFMLKRQPKSAK